MERQAKDRPVKRVVFVSPGFDVQPPPHEFVPLEDTHSDDDLVYPVRDTGLHSVAIDKTVDSQLELPVKSGRDSNVVIRGTYAHKRSNTPHAGVCSLASEPVLRLRRKLPRPRSLCFEVLVKGAYGLALIDSGATGSFVSVEFCRKNGLSVPTDRSSGVLADGSNFTVHGQLRNVVIKMHTFKFRTDLFVADLPNLDCVLGMDFLDHFDPDISWKKRRMSVTANHHTHLLHGV